MASPEKSVFRVSVLNWDKHNGSKKKNHRYFLFENRFFQDEKVTQLKPIEALFYIYLLTVASDLTRDSFEINTKSIPSFLRLRTQSIQTSLNSLQSLQLVTYEKVDSLINRKEENTKENKTKELSAEPKNSVPAIIQKPKELVQFKISSTLEIPISQDLITSWMETYPKEFIEEELKKARSWILSNPHKTPKSAWGRFFNSWLTRGWEKYRTTLKSNPTKLTAEDLSEILRGGL